MLFYRHIFFTNLLFFFLSIGFSKQLAAQCISTFPIAYTEDFENDNGRWTAGGTASDWDWGTPAKNVISTAGSGSKCWITGTLTGNFYNDNENSWLQSPCFDFTNNRLPYISFLVFWDTEYGYDGAALQYSDDNGISWQSLGAYGDVPTGCTNDNWYNQSYIKYAAQQQGWSGSYNNYGSSGWVTSYHAMPQLAGKGKVSFRFVFGAGKIANNFNGFAFDKVYVGEVPKSSQVSFTYTCNSARQVTFLPDYSDCVSLLQWNFGDAASGVQNTALGATAVAHTFTSTGSFIITLSGKGSNNEDVSGSQTVVIPDVSVNVQKQISCHGMTGNIEAAVNNATTAITYSWNTVPVINTAVAEVTAGYYTITASASGGCFDTASVQIDEPQALTHIVQTTAPDCNDLNGAISIAESGGVSPYVYSWSPQISATAIAANLSSGTYTLTITDQNACVDNVNVDLIKTPVTLSHSLQQTSPDCGEKNGSIAIFVSGGNPGYSYQWIPDVSNAESVQEVSAGNYTIIASDINQCRDTAEVTVTNKPLFVSLGKDTFICKGQTVLLKANDNFASYLWDDGSTMPVKEVSREGNYILQVSNRGGCTASDTVHINSGCGDLLFPSGITPNGDGLNEEFGPTGGLSLVLSYRLLVYNRYGGLVFQSVSPYKKWKGDENGIKTAGTFTYSASYIYNREKKFKKGTITLLF